MIRIGQIGIGHNHGETKMKAARKFPELFEVVGYAKENPFTYEHDYLVQKVISEIVGGVRFNGKNID